MRTDPRHGERGATRCRRSLRFCGSTPRPKRPRPSTPRCSRARGSSRRPITARAGPGTEGAVMTVSFELDGQRFIGLNGGPEFTFNEAISFQIDCETQNEVDTLWSTLSEGGEEGPCGWLKDRFGVSWQVVPRVLFELLADPDRERSQRVMQAMLSMKKIEIDGLERAAATA